MQILIDSIRCWESDFKGIYNFANVWCSFCQ